MAWKDLSVRDRAGFIRQMVSLGITNSEEQAQFYNNALNSKQGHKFDGDPAAQIPLPTVVKQGKSRMFTPGWWNKQASKLDNFAFAAGFVPVIGDAASFLADVGANFARYQYDKNDPTLPEWQRKEIANTNLKSGLGLAGIGALIGLAGTSIPSGKIKNAVKLHTYELENIHKTLPKPKLEQYSQFKGLDVQRADLPEYISWVSPSGTNIRLSTRLLKERFNQKDWIERMEGRSLTNEEYKILKKTYPKRHPKIKEDLIEWGDSYADLKKNTVHVGEPRDVRPEISQAVLAHELDHALGLPPLSEKQVEDIFGPISNEYFKEHGGTEMLARLGQIANWYGLTNIRKQPMTGNMLKYAAKEGNYVKKALMDNNMHEFFSILNKNNSWDAAAKAYNQYGKSIIPPALLIGTGTAAYNRFNQKEKTQKLTF